MPRPTTKTELLTAAKDQWQKMWQLIESMPVETRIAAFNFGNDPKLKEAHWQRDKNLSDVFMHLCEWQELLLDWVKSNMAGEAMPFLPKPYTWKTYGEMNMEFWEKNQNTDYEIAQNLLRNNHMRVIVLIERLSDEELFGKKHFPWTGTTNIGAYCISVTSSHYDWAMKKIKLHVKTYKA